MSLNGVEDIYPLGPMQQGILFHMLYEPQSEMYFSQFICSIESRLDVTALRSAWEMLLTRHPILRTAFLWEGLNEPLQVVSRQVDLPWQQHDWCEYAVTEQEQRLNTLLAEDRGRGWDLSTAPLLRLYLIQTGDQSYTFIASSPHLLLDGWSRALLLQEMLTAYEAMTHGKTPRLPRVRPYRDYISWIQRQNLAVAEAYWRKALQGFTTPTVLAQHGTSPSATEEAYRIEDVYLSSEETAALQEFARQQHLTLNTLVQAAWARLLSLYCSSEEVVFGVTVSGRPASLIGSERMVGLFINTLPLRVAMQPDCSLLMWLQRLQEQQVELLEQQHAPLVEIQGWSELPRGERLFESILVFENTAHAVSWDETASLQLLNMRGGVEQTNYPLTLIVAPDNELLLRLLYDARLFDAETITRILAHLHQILLSMVAPTTTFVRDLSPLSTAERHVILEIWNQDQSTAAEAEDVGLHALFEAQVVRTPDAIALVYEDAQLSYAELNRLATQWSHRLRQQGIEPEQLVGIGIERSPAQIIAILAVLKAGGAYLPIDPAYPPERLHWLMQDAGLKLVLVQRSTQRRFQHDQLTARLLCWEEFVREEAPAAAEDGRYAENITSQSLAYVIYTSGSTGRPKGVLATQQATINRLQWMWNMLPFEQGEVCCQKTSLSFVDAVWEIFGPLLQGIRSVLIADEVVKDPAALLPLLAREGVSRIVLVPSLLAALLENEAAFATYLASIKYWVSSGEALSGELARRFLTYLPTSRLINLYGSSEVAADATYYLVQGDERSKEIPLGRPITGMQAYVLDMWGDLLPAGIAGDLYLGGVGVARGYLFRPDLTAERFVPHSWSRRAGQRLYRTGDRARYRADGQLEFLGRQDYQVKLRGLRIELGEIEAALCQHPAVQKAVVVLQEEQPGDKRLVGYVVAQPGTEVTTAALYTYLSERLPAYMLPAPIVLLEALPLTIHGKLDRQSLPRPLRTPMEQSRVQREPRTPTEQQVLQIWQEVLHRADISIGDNFLQLGGHSLLAIQIISRVREAFAQAVPLRLLFETPTLEHFAAALEREQVGPQTSTIPVAVREGDLPVSYAQERMWFLHQLDGGESSAYTISSALRMRWPVNMAQLEWCFNQLIQRHEALRTSFVVIDGHPKQRIAAHRPLRLQLIDLGGLAEPVRSTLVRQLALAEARVPFDLEGDVLLRAKVLRSSAQEYVLLLSLHHIIADGWSLEVLIRELLALYRAASTGATASFAALPVQYVDYALWQREELQSGRLDSQLSYWKQRLGGTSDLLKLPTDYPRPAVQTYAGGRSRFVIPSQVSQQLHELSRQEEVTLFMLGLAALQVLLMRYSDQSDIAIGTPLAGRTHTELEKLVGLFVNTLVLRTDLSGDPTFRDLLKRVRAVTLEAYEHQEIPFEKVVDAVQPVRSLSHQPIFQVMYAWQNILLDEQELQQAELEVLEIGHETAKFDLTLYLWQSDDGLAGTWVYKSDLFAASTIENMSRHLQTLLQSIVIQPDQHISRLSLLNDDERSTLLTGWNPQPLTTRIENCLHQLFERRAEKTPDAVALCCDGDVLSYGEVNRRANQLAHYLVSLGVGPECGVGLLLERGVNLVLGLLTILKAGGAYLALDPLSPPERIGFMLADASIPLLLTQQTLSHLVEKRASVSLQVICMERLWRECAGEPETNGASCVQPGNLAYMIYTSGSTGKPKRAGICHEQVVNLFAAAQPLYHFDEHDSWTLFHSLSFDFSVWELWGALLYGGRLVVVPYWVSRAAEEFGQLLSREQITVLNQTPSAFYALQDAAREWPSHALSLRLVIFGGEALEMTRLQPWGQVGPQLINMYGITETTVHVTYQPVSEIMAHPREGSLIGRPLAHLQAYVLDESMQPTGIGVPGELYIGGAGLARGYLGRADLTAERFVPHPFVGTEFTASEPGSRLYKTGDRARFLQDGTLVYLGRVDRQVKLRGFRIELGEIEAALRACSHVRDAVVVLREAASGEHALVAYIVPEQAGILSTRDLRSSLQSSLPEYMVPAAFVEMQALPLTMNGKLDVRNLPAPTWEAVAPQSYAAPRTPDERTLAGIWADVLGIETVGIHTNFFEIGGDSILSLLVIARARQAGLQLTPKQMFQHQTIAGLAAVALKRASAVVKEEASQGSFPLLPVQAWFFEQELADPHHWNQAVCLEIPARGLVPPRLQQALTYLIEQHPALRLRFSRHGPVIEQSIAPQELAISTLLRTLDLCALANDEQERVFCEVANQMQASLNLESGPLLRLLHVIRGSQQPDLLLIVIHHLAIDGVSWRVLLEDLQRVYAQLSRGEEVQLPAQTTSFKTWSEHLQRYAGSATLQQERAYWLASRRREAPVLRPELDASHEANGEAWQESIHVSLDAEKTEQLLHEVPAVYHTQINEMLLSALLLATGPWLGRYLLLVNLEGHGREHLFDDIDISRTVGWFTTIFPVLLDLETLIPAPTSRIDLGQVLKLLKEQIRAIPQHGIGYGVLRYLGSDNELKAQLAAMPQTQVSFNYLGQFDTPQKGHFLAARLSEASATAALAGGIKRQEEVLFKPIQRDMGRLHSPRARRSHLLDITALVSNGELQVSWGFSARVFRRESIESLALHYREWLEKLINHCLSADARAYTPSDFPDLEISQTRLDKALNKLRAGQRKAQ